MVKLKICHGRKSQLVVSNQVATNPCCGLAVTCIFCGFISHFIGRKTINIPDIFSGVHGFSGKTNFLHYSLFFKMLQTNDNIYILLDILLCSIAEYFYKLCCILGSP